MSGTSLPDRIAQCYYTHGLLCSSHPFIAISIAISCFLFCCYPLLNLPLPGSIPLKMYLPYKPQDYQTQLNSQLFLYTHNNTSAYEHRAPVENLHPDHVQNEESNDTISLSTLMKEAADLPYIWAKEKPLVYIQQIILKTGVWPWREELRLSDAFRAPLQEVFKLLETIQNHQQPESGTSLSHLCFHIENVKRNVAIHKVSPVLPEYSCLVLSPANLWQQNIDRFLLDTNILSTVFNHQNIQKGKVSMAEMLFGMHLKDTGIKRYPFRARPRALQFAVTLFFQELNDQYVESLKEKLAIVYPLHQKLDKNHQSNQSITLIYYPGEFNYSECINLCVAFIGLFVYVYFSIRKLEFVRSKLGLSISVVASVAASLIMTIGFCFFFGLTMTFQGKEIYPYLVILVGVENVFVLTKSVMSIDFKLDVKIRLAQGLSKEGWSITKNLLIEITILTICLFTFIPVVQHICIFMIVGLICDFFIQMLFFTTVLGIDIKRKEELREKTEEFQLNQRIGSNQGRFFVQDFSDMPKSTGNDAFYQTSRMMRSKSHPKLNGLGLGFPGHTYVIANLNHGEFKASNNSSNKKTPKRIMLVKIWARTRFFQRAFMVWMVVWISMIVYNSGIIENIFDLASIIKKDDVAEQAINDIKEPISVTEDFNVTNSSISDVENQLEKNDPLISVDILDMPKNASSINQGVQLNKTDIENLEFNSEILNKSLRFISPKNLPYLQPWLRLSEFHWSSILAQYNISLSGRYVAVLPPVMVKHRVTPEKAASIHNFAEKDDITPPSRWHTLVTALDPIDLIDFEIEDGFYLPHIQLQPNWGMPQSSSDVPYYPTSPMEFLFLAILCSISVLVIAYTMVVVYRCVCTKNYAEWRTSWTKLDSEKQLKKPALQFIMEAVPTVVHGHVSDIECLATNGESIVSCCLQGQLKVWNSSNGDLITNIDRHVFFSLQNSMHEHMLYQEAPKNEQSSENSDSSLSSSNEWPIMHNSDIKEKPTIVTKPSESSSYNILPPFLPIDDINIRENALFIKKDHNHSDQENVHSKDYLQHSDHNHPFSSSYDLSGESATPVKNASLRNLDKIDSDSDIFNVISDSNGLPSVWCMDYTDDFIVLGCSDGRLEFWEASTGKLKGIYDDKIGASVSFVKFMEGMSSCGLHLIVARLSGYLDLLLVETSTTTQNSYKRTHIRTGSAGSITTRDESMPHKYSFSCEEALSLNRFNQHEDKNLFSMTYVGNEGERLHCRRLAVTKAHQQPITGLEYDGGKILTGSQDHTLKVFSSYDLTALYTLHGHCGPITCLFIDRFCPTVSGSGSEDGLLCVWDLMTGTCMYSIQAHDGPISELVYSESYVISMGADEKLCIWDRFRGHLLNSMNIGQGAGNFGMLSLTHSLVITGGRGGLTVWDASTGEAIRKVILGPVDGCVFVRKILPLRDAIVCDYASELRIVRFPIVSQIDEQFSRKND